MHKENRPGLLWPCCSLYTAAPGHVPGPLPKMQSPSPLCFSDLAVPRKTSPALPSPRGRQPYCAFQAAPKEQGVGSNPSCPPFHHLPQGSAGSSIRWSKEGGERLIRPQCPAQKKYRRTQPGRGGSWSQEPKESQRFQVAGRKARPLPLCLP